MEGFQKWLFERRAHDNPRGDLIRDYQGRVERGYMDVGPEGGFTEAYGPVGSSARYEMKRLVREWRRSQRVS